MPPPATDLACQDDPSPRRREAQPLEARERLRANAPPDLGERKRLVEPKTEYQTLAAPDVAPSGSISRAAASGLRERPE